MFSHLFLFYFPLLFAQILAWCSLLLLVSMTHMEVHLRGVAIHILIGDIFSKWMHHVPKMIKTVNFRLTATHQSLGVTEGVLMRIVVSLVTNHV